MVCVATREPVPSISQSTLVAHDGRMGQLGTDAPMHPDSEVKLDNYNRDVWIGETNNDMSGKQSSFWR